MTLLKSDLSPNHRAYTAEYRRRGYINNGWDRMVRWNGRAGTTVQAGIEGPSQALDSWQPAPATAAGDTSPGVHVVRYRYLDSKTGYVSNPSEEREVDVASGAEELTFNINTSGATNIIRSTDAKVDKIVIEMTTVDGPEFFKAAEVLNTASTVVVDIIDADLEVKFLSWPDDGHDPPPIAKYVVSHRERLWLFGQVVHTTGNADFTNASPDVGEGTTDPDWRESALGDSTATPATESDVAWFIQMDGDALAWEIDHYDESANKIVLKQNYSGSGGTDQGYKIFTRANSIWVSNEGYPEAFEPFKFLTGPASELAGDVTAGLGYGSGMLFWSQSCMFRLTWETSPQVDPFLVQLSNKYGALNQNTVIEVEGSVYSMDRHGIQMWRGVSPQHISRPIDQEIRDNVAWAQAENFHCVWHPKIRAIRFFVTYTSDTTDANDSSNYPRRYFQYDVDTGNWSTGRFYQGISASKLVPTSDGLEVYYGDENGHIWIADTGKADGCDPLYSHQKAGPNCTTTSIQILTNVGELLPTANEGVVGCYLYWLEGEEARLITTNTTTILTVEAFSSAPAAMDTLWIGPIPSKLRTRAYRPDSPTQKSRKGYFTLSFVPEEISTAGNVESKRLLMVRVYEDRKTAAKTWRGGANLHGGQVIWPENNASYNATDALFDLNDSRAEKGVLDFAIGKNFSRFVEIELEMLEPDAEVEILDMGFEIRGKKKQGS